MTFGEFASNYLNPIFVCLRLGILAVAYGLMMLTFFSTDLHPIAKLVTFVLGLYVAWGGIKPWGKGKTISDLKNDVDELEQRLKR